MKTITSTSSILNLPIQAPSFSIIPSFPRFQWLNHPWIVEILAKFFRPPARGRKGYDKVLMFRWLIWKQLMRCTSRDLEGISDIDYSTFIKFRQRLIARKWFARVFKSLTNSAITRGRSLFLVLDSSFVETYSKKKEKGVKYSGFKKKISFKLHQLIDFNTRLPLRQLVTGGARSDIILGRSLIRASPKTWPVKALAS